MAAELAVAGAATRRNAKVLALVGTGHFFAHFYVIVLPPLFPLLRDELAVSYAALGLLLTMPSLATMVLQTPVGFLVDRCGARWPLVIGLGLMSAAVAAAGFFATGYWTLFVLMILKGVGNSVFHPADYAILAARIEHRRLGRAFSVHTFAGHLGWAVAPGTVVSLTALWSWQAALAITGLCGLVVTLVIAAHGRELDAPAGDADPGAAPREAAQGPEAPPGRAGFALLFSAPMLLFFLYMVMAAVASAGLNGFTVTALVNLHGVGLTAANTALTALLIASALGVLLGGWLADRTRRHDLVLVAGFCLAAAVLMLIGLLSLPIAGVVAALALVGLAQGAIRPSRDMMVRAIAPAGAVGTVFGWVTTGMFVGAALAPVFFGWLIDRSLERWVFILAALAMLLALAAALLGNRRAQRALGGGRGPVRKQ